MNEHDEHNESSLRIDQPLTLVAFCDKVENLINEMRERYFESTGDDEPATFDEWLEQLTNSYIND